MKSRISCSPQRDGTGLDSRLKAKLKRSGGRFWQFPGSPWPYPLPTLWISRPSLPAAGRIRRPEAISDLIGRASQGRRPHALAASFRSPQSLQDNGARAKKPSLRFPLPPPTRALATELSKGKSRKRLPSGKKRRGGGVPTGAPRGSKAARSGIQSRPGARCETAPGHRTHCSNQIASGTHPSRAGKAYVAETETIAISSPKMRHSLELVRAGLDQAIRVLGAGELKDMNKDVDAARCEMRMRRSNPAGTRSALSRHGCDHLISAPPHRQAENKRRPSSRRGADLHRRDRP